MSDTAIFVLPCSRWPFWFPKFSLITIKWSTFCNVTGSKMLQLTERPIQRPWLRDLFSTVTDLASIQTHRRYNIHIISHQISATEVIPTPVSLCTSVGTRYIFVLGHWDMHLPDSAISTLCDSPPRNPLWLVFTHTHTHTHIYRHDKYWASTIMSSLKNSCHLLTEVKRGRKSHCLIVSLWICSYTSICILLPQLHSLYRSVS